MINKMVGRARQKADLFISRAITSVVTDKPYVALTFDDGPSIATLQLIDILEKYDAKATFFMVGRSIRKHESIAKEVLSQGHAVGNHTWSHPRMPRIPMREQLAELRACESVLPHTPLYRPPYGAQDGISYLIARSRQMKPVVWSRSGKDFLGYPKEKIYELATVSLRPGEIILLHDNLQSYRRSEHANRTPTLEAVEKILSSYSDDFTFVSIPKLLQNGKANWTNWSHV